MPYTLRMRVLFAAAEVHPFSKTGGLADVAGALPVALAALGHEVLVVTPWYRDLNGAPLWIGDVDVPLSGGFETAGVGTLERDGVRYVFIGHEAFQRDGLYGHADDVWRFALFSRAIPQAAQRVQFLPDVVHANDWHSAALPLILERGWHLPPGFSGLPAVFTVHNVQFQGESGLDEAIFWLRLPADADGSWLNRFGTANFMQGALGSSHHVTTVSPTYAREIQEPGFGFGLDGSFGTLAEEGRLTGILNGIDTRYWDPSTDPHLDLQYGPGDAAAGKADAKKRLARHFGLDPERPLMAAVSRLAEQKGIDILLATVPELLQQGWSVLVLGSGDAELEERMRHLARQQPQFAAVTGFDESLAHRIYAAADVLAVPSRFEPCGLTQMIAHRYGALPLVRSTGGLRDSVTHLRDGFSFDEAAPWSLGDAAGLATRTYGTPAWQQMQQAAMARDHSWTESARRYAALYSVIVGG